MKRTLASLFSDARNRSRTRTVGIYLLLIEANVIAWVWAFTALRNYPVLLGTAFLAYTLGLRHAFDADHIAAIDNVTRKLIQEGKRPVAAGLFFSLGHSTVVVGLSIAIALTTTSLQNQFDLFKNIGGVIATLASAFFLFIIAAANFSILISIYRVFRIVKKGGHLVEEDLERMLASQGFLVRLFRGLFRVIDYSWQMYPVGLLFGLGFDTATEVGLLSISATQAAQGMSVWSVLVFPALFTAGMTLMDTTESLLMVSAYSWAFAKPIRKLYYNLTTTAASIIVAVLVGGLQILDLTGDQLGFTAGRGFWGAIGDLNDNFATIGLAIVSIFIVAWLISYGIYRVKRYDERGASPTRSLPARDPTRQISL
jgi:high-affinity nickel-transport protein